MDTGHAAWVLTSASLVLLMTPGLALFYGGMTRARSVLNMMMMSFGAIGVVTVVYILWGWSMSYGTDVLGDGTAGLFGNPFEMFGLNGVADGDYLSIAFQVTFAIITTALISGAIADRAKFSTWLVFCAIWVTLSYFPLAHMVWGGGFLSGEPGALASRMFSGVSPVDYAGGTVVHINAGVAGLVLALVLGVRRGFGKEPMRPHSLPLTMLGAGLLWFGWFGFNAGSFVPSVGADDPGFPAAFVGETGLVWVNTTAAAAAAMLGWLAVEKMRDGKGTSLGAASGVVAGLVAITPACGSLSPVGSLLLGVVAGGLCSLAVVLVLLTVLVAVEWAPLTDLDEAVAQWAYDQSAGRDTLIALHEAIAFWLGPIALRLVLLACAVAALVRRELRVAVWLLVVVAVENIVAPWSKHLLDRERPVWAQPLTGTEGFSYPSGHAAAAGMLAGTLILLTIVLTQKGPVRRTLLTLWALLALVVASNRLFLGVHYLSDVVGGLVLGTFIAVAVWVGTMWNAVGETTERAATTGTGGKRLAVVLNPIKITDVEVFKGRLEIAADRAGWNPPLWLETLPDDPGLSMTEQALAEGVDLVIAAGGDGTVRIVCSELARTGVAAGIVPLGTGNLLARNLGIPLHIKDAIDTALNGQDRAIDIVSLSGEGFEDTSFMVMAGLGLDAAIMTGAPDELKAKMGWFAYVVSAVRQLFRFPATRVQISVDGGPFVKRRARTVVIGNVGYLQAGIPLLPDAVIDDGQLDVVVIAPSRRSGWVRVAARVFTKRKRTDERLDRMTGREVVVRADRPTPMQLDGDAIGEGIELRAEIMPGVLLVRVPH